jgi:hypothetical protein
VEESTSSQGENGGAFGSGAVSLELFFDLVLTFAFTQVTSFLSDHLTWTGVLQGAGLIAVLWWAWANYSWLTNVIPADDVMPARLINLTPPPDRSIRPRRRSATAATARRARGLAPEATDSRGRYPVVGSCPVRLDECWEDLEAPPTTLGCVAQCDERVVLGALDLARHQ